MTKLALWNTFDCCKSCAGTFQRLLILILIFMYREGFVPDGNHRWDVQSVVLADMDRMMVGPGRECQ